MPEDQAYTLTMLVDKSANEVFAAINNVRGWWSGDIDGATDKVGAVFTYRVQGIHESKQEITELIPGRKVVWHVVEAQLSFTKNPSEWRGTDIIFDLRQDGDKTHVKFMHRGLVPAFECYDNCSNAWSVLVGQNLRNLIATGKPQPSPW